MICETLIVSDVHLGSDLSLAADLLNLLKNSTFKRLILLGDIFSDLNFSRLTKQHWNLIGYIHKLSDPKRGVEVVWVEGNHDAGITQVMEHLLGVKVYQRYEWVWNNLRCLAIHGHQFDNLWAGGTPFLGGVATKFYIQLQKIGFLKNWLPRLIDRLHTHWERLSTKVADGALRLAARDGAAYVFCGHTHQTDTKILDGIQYFNSGSWVGTLGSYITLSDDGIQVREYQPVSPFLTPQS
jgi:UDP-2,3-diacylglucosamine pyrophosphatase LpxH